MILSLFRAKGLYIVNSEDNLREFGSLRLLFSISFFLDTLQGYFLSVNSVTFDGQVSNLVSDGHYLSIHAALKVGHFGLLLFQHLFIVLFPFNEFICGRSERLIAVSNLLHFAEVIIVKRFDILEELLIFFYSDLLLLYSLLL